VEQTRERHLNGKEEQFNEGNTQLQVASTTSHMIGLIETVTETWLCLGGGPGGGGGSSTSGSATWLTVAARRTPDRLVHLNNVARISIPAVQMLLLLTTVENPTYNSSLIC